MPITNLAGTRVNMELPLSALVPVHKVTGGEEPSVFHGQGYAPAIPTDVLEGNVVLIAVAGELLGLEKGAYPLPVTRLSEESGILRIIGLADHHQP